VAPALKLKYLNSLTDIAKQWGKKPGGLDETKWAPSSYIRNPEIFFAAPICSVLDLRMIQSFVVDEITCLGIKWETRGTMYSARTCAILCWSENKGDVYIQIAMIAV